MMELSSFENNLFLLLFLAAVMHSFYLALLLFVKSQKEKGLGWLGLMMIPVSLWLLTYLLYIGNIMRLVPHLLGVFAPLLYFMGPAYFFFVRRSADLNHRFRWYDLLHLIPILYVTWTFLPLYGYTAEAKIALIDSVYTMDRPSLIEMLRGNQLIFLVFGYVAATYYFLKKRLHHAEYGEARLHWLLRFTLVFALILVLDVLIKVIFISFQWEGAIMEMVLVLIIAVAIHLLGYVVLGKDKVLPDVVRPSKSAKYVTSPLHSSQIKAYQKTMVNYLETERPWLHASFSITDLARALNIPRHHLSQVLNEGMQTGFNDLISQYRINEVKQRLQSDDVQKYSLLGIATDCGFGSKSSFNRAFKKETGMTPSAWLKTLQKQNITEE